MGFGRGVGFTPTVKTIGTRYSVKAGGRKWTKAKQIPNPTYTTTVA